MNRSRGWHGAALAVLTAALLAPTSQVVATPDEADPSTEITIKPADPLLSEPMRGEGAIERLGTGLRVSAARNDMRPADLRELLRQDPTAWVDPDGRVRFVEPAHAGEVDEVRTTAQAPLSETFLLHSNPAAGKKIFLDFDGATVSGTAWNSSDGVIDGFHPGWDPSANGPEFDTIELAMVQQIWAMVAEDYAPFDVDVTTQDPGPDGLTRSSSSDGTYGSHVLVSDSVDALNKICGGICGGVAYIDVFSEIGDFYQPAWVFPEALADSPKNIAEAASHEVGHNLALLHDGASWTGYYEGHGIWAPIMGVGYSRPLAQWSAGTYPSATNQQDDVATITGHLGTRTDEASGDVGLPSALPAGTALITSRTDVDAFALGTCTSGSTVQVDPAALAPDLDLRAALYDATGVQRAVADPPSGFGDGVTAEGLDATLTVPTGGDGWVVTVEGVGQGTWTTDGYDDYGSLGAYTVSAPGCDGADSGLPSAPQSVTAGDATPSSLTLSWTAPSGPAAVTGYVVSRSGSSATITLPAGARSHTFTGLASETDYRLSVHAINEAGAGPAASADGRTTVRPPSAPSAPRDVTGTYEEETDSLLAYWTEPADTGTQPISGYRIFLDGRALGLASPDSRGVRIGGGFPPGSYVVGIAAVNAVGQSPRANVTIVHEGAPPSPPGNVTAKRGDRRAVVSWSEADGHGSPITGYTVTASPGGRTCTTTTLRCTVTRLVNGRAYRFRVVATSALGSSEPSSPSAAVTPAARPGKVRPTVAVRGRTATVRWKAARPNGAKVTRYLVDISRGRDRSLGGRARSTAFKRLAPGRYRVRVAARNAVGRGAYGPWVAFRIR